MRLTISPKVDDRGLRVRSQPDMHGSIIAILQAGEMVETLESESVVLSKLGSKDQWLQVKTSNGLSGYCAAWLLTDPVTVVKPQTEDQITYLVIVSDTVGSSQLRLRIHPESIANTLASEPSGTILTVLESKTIAQPRLGVYGQWLHIQDPQGRQGYVSAYYVKEYTPAVSTPAPKKQTEQDNELIPLTDQLPIQPTNTPQADKSDSELTPLPAVPAEPVVTELIPLAQEPLAPFMVKVSNSVGTRSLRLRSMPSLTGSVVGVLPSGALLEVLEPEEQALSKVGVFNQWLNVKDNNGRQGYTAAWFVEPIQSIPSQAAPAIETAPPVEIKPTEKSVYEVPILSQDSLYGNAACSPVSACMLLEFYHGLNQVNRTVTPQQLISMLDPGDGTPGKGMSLSNVTDELESLGYKHISQKVHASLVDLKAELVNGPFVVTVGVKLAGPGTVSSGVPRSILGPGSTIHAMVIKGILGDAAVVNDPWTGKELSLPMDNFGNMWKLGLNGMYMIRP
jgi:uncharacterized protein YgiM (DUF1202 family)